MIKDVLKEILGSGFKFWQVLIIVMIVGLVAPAVPATLEYFFWQKKQEYTLNDLIDSGSVVNETLSDILQEYDGNRIFLGEFYNGTHFTSGNPLARFLLTHEITALGTAPLPMPFREMPVSFASDVFKQVQSNDVMEYDQTNMTNSVFRHMMVELDLERLYLFGVHDPAGNLVAILGLDFRDDTTLTTEQTYEIQRRVDSLAGFLNRT